MKTFDYDLIVIGAGSGGISSAILGKNLGKKVALVEKKRIGGDCTWYGCVPSKALIKSAEIARHFNQMGKYGLSLDGAAQLDTRKVMAHVRAVREQIYEEETPQVFEKMGIDVLNGGAKFLDNHRIQVGSKTIASQRFIIATGSSPLVPPIEGIEDVPYLTNETLFDLQELPASMVIIGGGPIGTEMASALNHLGVQITQLEMADGIMVREDKELAALLQDHLQQSGIRIMSSTTARKVERRGDKLIVTAENESSHEIETDALLLSVGRSPNVNGLDLDKAGVAYSRQGIRVNETLQTSAANIYAIGDVVGAYQFSHIAEYHAGIAVPNALLPLPIKRKVNYAHIVWATFTDPELAHGGFTEEEAREKYGDKINVYRFNYDRVDRAKTDRATIGMSKFIVDKKGKLLGIHILGERAAELLHQAQLAKSLGVPFHKIQSMIHVYPTYGDMVKRPSVAAYVDKLQNNFFIKTLRKITK